MPVIEFLFVLGESFVFERYDAEFQLSSSSCAF